MLALFPHSAARGLRSLLSLDPQLRSTTAPERLGAVRVHVAALALALGTAAIANGQVVVPERPDAESGRATGAFVHTGVAIYHGRELDYEVIDGLAIHGGDMVLGTVEEVTSEYRRQRSTKTSTGWGPERRNLSTVEDPLLWPEGVIPYVIEPGFTETGLERINAALEEWNSRTVITLVPRTTEPDYGLAHK